MGRPRPTARFRFRALGNPRVVVPVLLALASCTSPELVELRFTGHDVSDPKGHLILQGDKAQGRIRLRAPKDRYELSVPYAEDWRFTTTERVHGSGPLLALQAASSEQGFYVRLTIVESPGHAVDREAYLREEVLKDLKSRVTANGQFDLDRPVLERVDGEPVLDCIQEDYRRVGFFYTRRELADRWFKVYALRQEGAGPLYRIELTAWSEDDDSISKLRPVMRNVAGKGLRIAD